MKKQIRWRVVSGLSWLFAAVATAFVCPPAFTQDANVQENGPDVIKIYPEISREVNGFNAVQPIFGGCVNGESMGKAVDEIRALNLNTARAYFWSANAFAPKKKAPHTPWNAAQHGGKPVSAEDAEKQAEVFFTQDMQAAMDYAYTDGKFLKWAQGQQLEQFHKWGLTDNIIFHMQVDGFGDKYPDGVNNLYAAYIDAIKKYGNITPDFVQMTNEPNYSWFAGQFASTKECVDTWIRMWNRLDDYLRKNRPETKLVGPCLASSSFYDWGEWRRWTQPVLKGATHPFELYNYHTYGVGDQSHLAWLQMLQAQGEEFRSVRPRAVITEINGYLQKVPAPKRFDYTSQLLFSALANPDKFAMLEYFLVVYPGKGNHFNESNILDINRNTGEIHLTDVYWLYWVLSQVRGKMAVSDAPVSDDVCVFTSLPADNSVTTCVLNRGEKPYTVKLSPVLKNAGKLKSTTCRFVHYNDGALEHGETVSSSSELTVTLPVGGVASVQWVYDAPVPEQTRTLAETEYYAKTSAAILNDAMQVSLPVKRLPQEDETVLLHLGVYSDDLLRANGLNLSVNGHPLSVFWTEAQKEEGVKPQTQWRLNLPVKRAWIQNENTISFQEPDSEYRLMFASLVYNQQLDAETAKAVENGRIAKRERAIAAFFKPLPAMFSGEKTSMVLSIENRSSSTKIYTVELSTSEFVTLAKTKKPVEIKIASGSRKTITDTIVCALDREIMTSESVQARIVSGGESCVFDLPVYLYPRRTAGKVDAAPAFDGTLTGWQTMPEVVCEIKGVGISTRTGWDEKNLYVRAEVHGDFRPLKPDTVANCWAKDCVEVFVDGGNDKSKMYDEDDHQYMFCPLGVDSDEPLAVQLIRKRKGDVMAIVDSRVGKPLRASSVVSDNGYVLAVAIPWETVKPGFRPAAGKMIGCDVAVGHARNTDGISFGSSVFGLPGKFYDSPEKWGILTLQD